MSNKSGMIVVGVVLVALLVLIQTCTITAARSLPTSANNVVDVAQHVPASVSSKSALLPKDCGFRFPPPGPRGQLPVLPPPYSAVPVAAATSDVDRPVPASANADKVQVAVATNDVPNVDRRVPAHPSHESIHPQTMDFVVGGPSVHV